MKLSDRENQILLLITEEHTSREIARRLCISHRTVENHRLSILQKLGVKNTAGLMKHALKAGLINN